MREIKFRGFGTATKCWLYGNLIRKEDPTKAEPTHWCTLIQNKAITADIVYDDSVGQYIGVKDKNGNEIYEGDIVYALDRGTKAKCEVRWRQDASPCWILFPAWQSNQMWSISSTNHEKGKQFISVSGQIYSTEKIGYYDDGLEVIGNVFQNPELLKP